MVIAYVLNNPMIKFDSYGLLDDEGGIVGDNENSNADLEGSGSFVRDFVDRFIENKREDYENICEALAHEREIFN